MMLIRETKREILNDFNRCFWKLGDIVKFHNGYYSFKEDKWKEWFMNKEDYLESLENNYKRNPNIPIYARLEYSIIISRYRIIKYKNIGTFMDYGSELMMLSGSKKGHIKRVFAKNSFNKIDSYPYSNIKSLSTKLFNGVDVNLNVELFIQELIRKFNYEYNKIT